MAKRDKNLKGGIDLSKRDKVNPIISENQSSTRANITPKDLSDKKTIKKDVNDVDFPIPMENFKFMLLAFALIILGFILMAGGEEDIYSFRKITLSVLVCMSGFVFMIYAIMRKPTKSESAE